MTLSQYPEDPKEVQNDLILQVSVRRIGSEGADPVGPKHIVFNICGKMGVSPARAGEVLAGKRNLSINMIWHLVTHLGMDAATLIGARHSDAA